MSSLLDGLDFHKGILKIVWCNIDSAKFLQINNTFTILTVYINKINPLSLIKCDSSHSICVSYFLTSSTFLNDIYIFSIRHVCRSGETVNFKYTAKTSLCKPAVCMKILPKIVQFGLANLSLSPEKKTVVF